MTPVIALAAFGFLLLGAAAVFAVTGTPRVARRCTIASIGVVVAALALTGVAEVRFQRCISRLGTGNGCARSPWQAEPISQYIRPADRF